MAKQKKVPVTNPHTLSDLLLALQKSVSRVNRDSVMTEERIGSANALITGDINFAFSVKCDLADDDVIQISREGALSLNMEGTVSSDVNLVEQGDDSSETGATEATGGGSGSGGQPGDSDHVKPHEDSIPAPTLEEQVNAALKALLVSRYGMLIPDTTGIVKQFMGFVEAQAGDQQNGAAGATSDETTQNSTNQET